MMAGRMPGRRPLPARNPLGRVLQRIRMEAGISRRRAGLPDEVETSAMIPFGLIAGQTRIPRTASQRPECLRILCVEMLEAMEVALGTVAESEVVARALGRILKREKDRAVIDKADRRATTKRRKERRKR